MSVAVWYMTKGPVDRETGDKLLNAAGEIPPLIWYEPIHLFVDGEYPTVVKGWSKVPPMTVQFEDESVVDIPDIDWGFMDYMDSGRLFNQLAEWSSKFGVDWVLTEEGQKLGKIKSGKLSWGLRRCLASSARMGKAKRDLDVDSAREAELLKKYPFF